MREIFKTLRNRGFICEDCISATTKNSYRLVKDNYEAYFKYFIQLGYYLEQGPGYFHLCEARPSQNVQALGVLEVPRTVLAPGYQFKAYDLQMFCDQNDELRAVLPISQDGQLSTRVTLFLKDVEKEGFIDFTTPDASTCMVTSAFSYLKELILRIRLYDQHAKFNLDYEPKVEEPQEEEPEQDIVENNLELED